MYRDGEKFGDPVDLEGTEETPWTYTWKDLDKTDIEGKEYEYSIDEVKVPTYYRKSISEDGLTVTNIYSPPSGPYIPPTDPTDSEEPEEPTKLEEPEETDDPEEPELPNPTDPTDRDDPIESTGADEGEEDIFFEIDEDTPLGKFDDDDDTPSDDVEIDILPKTGESSKVFFYIIGLLFILIGLMISKRKTA